MGIAITVAVQAASTNFDSLSTLITY